MKLVIKKFMDSKKRVSSVFLGYLFIYIVTGGIHNSKYHF